MKLTKAIEALRTGNERLCERIRVLRLQETTLHNKVVLANSEWVARGQLLDAMVNVQALLPDDETIDFVVPGDYE